MKGSKCLLFLIPSWIIYLNIFYLRLIVRQEDQKCPPPQYSQLGAKMSELSSQLSLNPVDSPDHPQPFKLRTFKFSPQNHNVFIQFYYHLYKPKDIHIFFCHYELRNAFVIIMLMRYETKHFEINFTTLWLLTNNLSIRNKNISSIGT